MKLVVLAGGRGTRLSEETATRPKPMVEIGGRPILWHILKLYAAQGVNEAIICAGYRAGLIETFFEEECTSRGRGAAKSAEVHLFRDEREAWTVHVVDTGVDTMTGGRLRRVRDLIGDERFHLTYGDGLSDVNISALETLHQREGARVTLTAAIPPPRYGAVALAENSSRVEAFGDEATRGPQWINGGFFVVEPSVLNEIEDDAAAWETTLASLAQRGELAAYRHRGFWRAMDTLHDRQCLEALWAQGAPWKVW